MQVKWQLFISFDINLPRNSFMFLDRQLFVKCFYQIIILFEEPLINFEQPTTINF